ncbi:hypothetical protein ACJJTC_006101, partial [Scirpophaga incertulas]
ALDEDKAELEAISEVFCKKRSNPLLVLLSYQSGKIPANLHYENPREDISALAEGRMRIVSEHQPFQRSYVGVNNISVTGCVAHVLLNGRYKPKIFNQYKSSIPYLVTLSGRQESAVHKILDNLKSRPIDPEELALLHNVHTLDIFGHLSRGFGIFETNAEGKTSSLSEQCEYFDNARKPLWFVYSGMGSQWPGMAAQLMRIATFAAAIDRCQKALAPKGIDIVEIITSEDKTIFDNILHSFVGIAAVQIGLTDVLKELDLVPDKIIGHSVGELGCAYADGCFTAEEMILSAYSRGLVSLQTPFIRGSMAAVGLGYEQIIKMVPPEIEVACHNSAASSTISGPADSMKEFVASLTAKGIFAKEVPCSNIAYHSRYIADAGPGLLKYLSEVIKEPKPRSERWVSTSVPQDRWDQPLAKYSSAEYHTNNLLSPVLFEETSRLIPPDAVLLEIAPHGLLQAILKRSLPKTCKNIPLTRRGHPDNALLVLEGIGKLYMEGYNPHLQNLYPKINFPVSTGTPMLSHLVEWMHNENWVVLLYMTAHRKTAAAAKYIQSVHDVEHSYLRGHVVRGRITYPASATLVNVWDTLAMSVGETRKQVTVKFRDVHFYAHPILNEQHPIRMAVSINRGNGYFEVINESSKVASGYISIVDISPEIFDAKNIRHNRDVMFNSDAIYQMFHNREHYYGGEFRSIHCTNSSFTEAYLYWTNNWVTLIDGMIQLNTLKHNYNGTSQPDYIRNIVLDVQEQFLANIVMKDNKTTLKTSMATLFDQTRCGGILIEGIKFKDLPPIKTKDVLLKTLKFVPRFETNVQNVKSILAIYLQMVFENVDKDTINVFEIKENDQSNEIFNTIADVQVESTELKISYHQISTTDDNINKLVNADLVLVCNLSLKNSMKEFLFKYLKRNVFVISAEKCLEGKTRFSPSSINRILASQNAGDAYLHLYRWRPSPKTNFTTAFTIRAQTDIPLLKSIRDRLQNNHRLLILSSYPLIDGLKDLVKLWRREPKQNQVYLVMVNHKLSKEQDVSQFPELDMVYNILDHILIVNSDYNAVSRDSDSSSDDDEYTRSDSDVFSVRYVIVLHSLPLATYIRRGQGRGGRGRSQRYRGRISRAQSEVLYQDTDGVGIWGGEYYVPVIEAQGHAKYVTLESKQIGDLNSLNWVEMRVDTSHNIPVSVHYTGLNLIDVCKATGVCHESENGTYNNSYGMDFSGVLDSGMRVMGLVRNGSMSTRVLAQPSLLWPIPDHWTMEDAATVPLAYAHAFYCLNIKCRIEPGNNILVHGATGGLGLAAISIALEYDLEIFATVSDVRKKQFLRKVYPQIKEDHIGSSRDISFTDMVLSLTNGKGVKYVINCGKGLLKNASMKCLGLQGTCLDTAQVRQNEPYSFGMNFLTGEKNFVTVDFSSIFTERKFSDIKNIQFLVAEGISRGYVRPLPRVSFPSEAVTRAFRLMEASQHRGRVLLRLCDKVPLATPRFVSSPDHVNVIISDDVPLGYKLVDWLITKGAKKIVLQQIGETACSAMKMKYWQTHGIDIKIKSEALSTSSVDGLLKGSTNMGQIHGLYLVSTENDKIESQYNLLKALDGSSRENCTFLKHFAVITTINPFGNEICIARRQDRLPATKLFVPYLPKAECDAIDLQLKTLNARQVCDTLEIALLSGEAVTFTELRERNNSLLEKILNFSGLAIPKNISSAMTLGELGVCPDNMTGVDMLLKDEYGMFMSGDQILSLTVQQIQDIDSNMNNPERRNERGLATYFTHVDTDELTATTEMVFLPTLTSNAAIRDDEFDVNQTYLCIVPGLEGHYGRFREVCEQLKLPALVLQPGLDLPNETIQQTAARYANILLTKASIKNNFYLMGYESGVLVALEMTAILERHGLQGTVYCVGTSPNEFKNLLKTELKDYKSESDLQNAIIRHMHSLMTNGESTCELVGTTWQEKVEACVRALLGRVAHSAQYARAQFEAAYNRIVQVCQYTPNLQPLKSKLVLLYASTDSNQSLSDTHVLQQYSLQPITVHDLRLPLCHALKDIRCSAIINEHLDSTIIEEFQTKNLCETYLLNAETFMALE